MDRYIEPFVGAGAVFLDLEPKNALINDSNALLIDTYRAIATEPESVIVALERHAAAHSKTHYYEVRALDRQANYADLPLADRAARLIYLNKACFNGLYRVNAKGYFNVPYGRYDRPSFPTALEIRAISHYLRCAHVELMCGDFTDATADATADSFVYFDPPYDHEQKGRFTAYQADGFDRDEQQRLYETYADLTSRGVKCLLSNADTPFIRDLYREYVIEIVYASRAINRDAAGRGKVCEVLIRNYDAPNPEGNALWGERAF